VRSVDPTTLLAAARGGDCGSTGRLLSLLERGGAAARSVGQLTYAAGLEVGAVIGITGAPGAGKSTLTNAVMAEVRRGGERVGVLAIDPTSPFSGGAILGDRVRMQRHAGDGEVFVRSVATRGHPGGLARPIPEAIRVLGAVGISVVIVETVGVGQVEVDIAGAADTAVVMVTPGWGDSLQTSKAGLLEIADVFVVNKADRAGASEARQDLQHMVDLDPAPSGWRPPVLLTSAIGGEGVAELWATLQAHRAWLGSSGEGLRRRARHLEEEMAAILTRQLQTDVTRLSAGARWAEARGRVVAGATDPHTAVDELIDAARSTERPPAL